jgi:NADPH:quinone reductase-like Zn-dependent oxidoreductase
MTDNDLSAEGQRQRSKLGIDVYARALPDPDMAEQHRILTEISKLIDKGVLHTTFRENYGPINAGNLRRAHAAMESGRGIGKIVLSGF